MLSQGARHTLLPQLVLWSHQKHAHVLCPSAVVSTVCQYNQLRVTKAVRPPEVKGGKVCCNHQQGEIRSKERRFLIEILEGAKEEGKETTRLEPYFRKGS